MGERKAVNKYYPPDWTPEQGSLDRYHGQHPLRERARKLGQGILIIRFEMPYNIWCGGCGNHIGMGVRYNAEKKKVGNYYTTPIYRFRMKCHLCDNHFEIETDPKNCDYVIVSGARRKEERWEPSATETVELTDREDAKKMATDPMFKLEHGVKDQEKSKSVQPTLGQLQEVQSVWKDDYAANQLLRKKFRETKREVKAQEMKDSELKQRAALDVALVPERLEDIELAKKIRYHGEGFDEHRRKRRFEVNSRPMFGKSDEKREKIKHLLGKRKQIKFDSFSNPSKGNSDLVKLGIKVRRNASTNSEDSEECLDKDTSLGDCGVGTVNDPSNQASTVKDIVVDEIRTDCNLDRVLASSVPDTPAQIDIRTQPSPEVTSQFAVSFPTEKGEFTEAQCLTKRHAELKNISSSSTAVRELKTTEQNGFSQSTNDNLTRNHTSSGRSLVCCDYTDSSDASDDTS